jgi:ribonuclease HI
MRVIGSWDRSSLQENLLVWFVSFPHLRHFPFLILWGIWKYRNKILFEDRIRSDDYTISHILLAINEHTVSNELDKMDYILNSIFFGNTPIGFFDGATIGGLCGIGIFIKLNVSHIYKGYFVGGKGNNIKVEIMGLWGLLSQAKKIHIDPIMVAGDSKAVLDWISNKSKLDILALNSWKTKIERLRDMFYGINFMHVHRQFNKEADILSKKALSSLSGWLFVEEIFEGLVTKNDRFHMF